MRGLYRRLLYSSLLLASPAQASMLKGETLDKVANVVSWIVLIAVPPIVLVVFWLIHILPEKVAERRHHPQLAAIKVLCLLSLLFGGLLWPLAWLWAYTKPVLHKMAYGTATAEPPRPPAKKKPSQRRQLQQLLEQLQALERKDDAERAALRRKIERLMARMEAPSDESPDGGGHA
jgi:hypothetical protein